MPAHAGVDTRLGDRQLLGLKLTSAWMDDTRQRDAYAHHAVPGMTRVTTVSGLSGAAIDYGTLPLSVKCPFRSDPVPTARRDVPVSARQVAPTGLARLPFGGDLAVYGICELMNWWGNSMK